MEQTNKPDAKAAFVSIGSYPVRLTYLFTDPATVIEFTCKMAMSADDIAARQAFYALPAGDMEKGEFDYNVDMLTRIATDVVGLPGFDWNSEHEVVEGNTRRPRTLAEALKEYFASGEPILRKIAKDAVAQYNRIAEPQEFFR